MDREGEQRRLCESDFRFMSVLWEHEPVSSMKLVELCREKFGWKKSTTFTMIKKLGVKGLLQNKNAVVTALIPREKVQAAESGLFLNQVFNGSLPNFLVSFFNGKTISNQEADELKRLIDEYREDEK